MFIDYDADFGGKVHEVDHCLTWVILVPGFWGFYWTSRMYLRAEDYVLGTWQDFFVSPIIFWQPTDCSILMESNERMDPCYN